MNSIFKISAVFAALVFIACSDDDNSNSTSQVVDFPFDTEFVRASSIQLPNSGSEDADVPEISAYDNITQQIFSTNAAEGAVEITDISDVENPASNGQIDITVYGGNLNSVAIKNGLLAVAVEGNDSAEDRGRIVVFNTNDLTTPVINLEAGFLPDMVTFSPEGKYILSANEGEPNDDNTVDPEGSVSIIDVENATIETLTFEGFNNQEAALEAEGFRVFGETNGIPNTLAVDVEPEYIAVSDDSATAYVALQENNGIAVIDIVARQIIDIFPLGVKDFNDFKFDVSNRDDTLQLNNWNVLSYYQPDAIEYFTANGTGYIISANEGDSRDYDAFSEEVRVEDLTLDPTIYPDAATLQLEENLGRLNTTTANGDTDGDGDVDQIYAYGGRSFSIWSTAGDLVYDRGNMLTLKAI